MKKIRFKFKNFHSLKLEKPSNVSISVFPRIRENKYHFRRLERRGIGISGQENIGASVRTVWLRYLI